MKTPARRSIAALCSALIAMTLTTASMSGANADGSDAPTVVDSLTTSTEQVTDNQDGTFTLTTSRDPVRALTPSGWRPLDLALHVGADGRVSPAVAANPVSFSGGGNTPTAVFDSGDGVISFALPGSLPTPTLSGPTATYENIYPDVDLQLTATPTGFTDTLVIHNAAAAANPAVTSPRWTVTTTGISLDRNSDGTLSTTHGDETISTDVPTLWDSTPGDFAPPPSATDIGTGHAGTVAATTSDQPTESAARSQSAGTVEQSTTITLSPSPAQLTGPDVHYPVYLDPGMNATRQHTTTVSSGGVHAYDSGSRPLQVGYCNWNGCGSLGVARSFFSLNTSALTSKPTTAKIFSASVSVDETHSAASAPTAVSLWSTNGFSSGTTWPGPAKKTKLGTISSAAGFRDNNSAWLKFTGSAVTNVFQSAANSDTKSTTFGLIAPNEGDAFEWKTFKNNPVATITYGFPPATPSKLHIGPAITCPNHSVYVGSPTGEPLMYATTQSYNPSNTPGIGMNFRIYKADDGTLLKQTKTPVAGSNTTSAQQITWNSYSGNTTSTAALPRDISRAYHLQAQAVSTKDGTVASPWSSSYSFTYDIHAPSDPVFSVNPDGTLQVHTTYAAGIMWSTTEQGLPTLGQTTCNYNQVLSKDSEGHPTSGYLPITNDTVTLPSNIGFNRIYAKAFDDAHNVDKTAACFDPTKADHKCIVDNTTP